MAKWKYRIAEETAVDGVNPSGSSPDSAAIEQEKSNLREKTIMTLRQKTNGLESNQTILNALDNCINEILSQYGANPQNESKILACIKEKTKGTKEGNLINQLLRPIEEFLSGQATQPMGTIRDLNQRTIPKFDTQDLSGKIPSSPWRSY